MSWGVWGGQEGRGKSSVHKGFLELQGCGEVEILQDGGLGSLTRASFISPNNHSLPATMSVLLLWLTGENILKSFNLVAHIFLTHSKAKNVTRSHLRPIEEIPYSINITIRFIVSWCMAFFDMLLIETLSSCFHVGTWNYHGWLTSVFLSHGTQIWLQASLIPFCVGTMCFALTEPLVFICAHGFYQLTLDGFRVWAIKS